MVEKIRVQVNNLQQLTKGTLVNFTSIGSFSVCLILFIESE